jgi:hypothetical protein
MARKMAPQCILKHEYKYYEVTRPNNNLFRYIIKPSALEKDSTMMIKTDTF